MVTVKLTINSTTPKPRAMKSLFANGLLVYQVRFLFFPKPRSSIALEIVSIRFKLVRINGRRMFTEFFSLEKKCSFFPSSTPLACCAWLILW